MLPDHHDRCDGMHRGRWRRADDWVLRNQRLLAAVTVVVSTAVVLFDVYLAWVLKQPTISRQVWTATEEHPALIAGGMFATLGVCWLVRTYWGLVVFLAFVGGHLFAHN